MKPIFVFCFLLSLFAAGCSKSTDPEQTPQPFMMLNVGDKRQYISKGDSSTSMFEFTGKTKRADGQEVYIGIWTYGTFPPSDSAYYFIKDGFFISTLLDTTTNKAIRAANPFYEQRLAKLFPVNKETWIHTLGDTNKLQFYAESKGQMEMPSGKYGNVFAYILSGLNLNVYYAEGYGHIGSEIPGQNAGSLSCYIRVNGAEKGKLLPPKDLKPVFNKAAQNRINPFGQKVKLFQK